MITAREYWDRQSNAAAFEAALADIERRLLVATPIRRESGKLMVELKIPLLAELNVPEHLIDRLVDRLKKAGYKVSLQTETGFDIEKGDTPAFLVVTTYEDQV